MRSSAAQRTASSSSSSNQVVVSPIQELLRRFRHTSLFDFAAWVSTHTTATSSEHINAVLSKLSGTDVAATVATLRLVIALHFILGRRASFSLNAEAVARLVLIAQWARENAEVYGIAADLAVQLLTLSMGSATVGVERQVCAELVAAAASGSSHIPRIVAVAQQRLHLPLVYRSLYVRSLQSLSAELLEAMVRQQALDPFVFEQTRCVALAHVGRQALEDVIVTQLRTADLSGPKPPLFGAAPHATGPDGKRLVNTLCLPFACEVLSESQVHHPYIVSSLSAYIENFYAAHPFVKIVPAQQTNNNNNGSAGSPSQRGSLNSNPNERFPLSTAQLQRAQLHVFKRPLPFNRDMATVLVQYLQSVLEGIASFLASVKQSGKAYRFSHGSKGIIGLHYVESILCETIRLTRHLHAMYADIASCLVGDVLACLYTALALSTVPSALPGCVAPELSMPDVTVQVAKHTEDGPSIFSPQTILRCIELQIDVASVVDAENFINDLFVEPTWSRLMLGDHTFGLHLLLALYRNRSRLRPVLFRLSPRIFWLLSQHPHVLFPVVRRLLPLLHHEATSLDMFLRIIFLPLLCFSSTCEPDEGANDRFTEGLWAAMLDFRVDERRRTTALADFCLQHSRSADQWDDVHQAVGVFSPAMMAAFRVGRPLLTEFFHCAPLPPLIVQALGIGGLFALAPADCRDAFLAHLQELGRRALQACPELVLVSANALVDLLRQDFMPHDSRCWASQRWAAMLGASALSEIAHLDATAKEALRLLDIVHELVWELTATLSTEVVAQMGRQQQQLKQQQQQQRGGGGGGSSPSPGRKGAAVDASPRRRPLPTSAPRGRALAHLLSPLGAQVQRPHIQGAAHGSRTGGSSVLPQGSNTAAAAASSSLALAAAEPDWRHGQAPWVASDAGRHRSVDLFEHLHALIISLSLLTRLCPSARERGMICLANVVRTLSRSSSTASLVHTATLCMKTIRLPGGAGRGSMPLRALLGVRA